MRIQSWYNYIENGNFSVLHVRLIANQNQPTWIPLLNIWIMLKDIKIDKHYHTLSKLPVGAGKRLSTKHAYGSGHETAAVLLPGFAISG